MLWSFKHEKMIMGKHRLSQGQKVATAKVTGSAWAWDESQARSLLFLGCEMSWKKLGMGIGIVVEGLQDHWLDGKGKVVED